MISGAKLGFINHAFCGGIEPWISLVVITSIRMSPNPIKKESKHMILNFIKIDMKL